MLEAVIAGYLRTAQPRSRPNDSARGWFHTPPRNDLLSRPLPKLLMRRGIKGREIEDRVTGATIGVSTLIEREEY
jgi:acetyl-CoA acyltransferase